MKRDVSVSARPNAAARSWWLSVHRCVVSGLGQYSGQVTGEARVGAGPFEPLCELSLR